MRHESAFTIRVELDLSCTKKYRALPREKKIDKKNTPIIILINIVIAFRILTKSTMS